jgi:hypothetical protein
MQTKLKKHNYALLFAIIALLCVSSIFTSCKKDDGDKSVQLLSFGPSPVSRGAELRFIGTNLDKVTSIILPDNIEITAAQFTEISSGKISLTVPQEAVEGYIVLKTPEGDITTRAMLGFTEPMSIASFDPATIKPGEQLTISGDYLNLVHQFIFTSDGGAVVNDTDFISQTREEIVLVVPFEAKTGPVTLSNGAADPILVISTTDLNVVLPAFTSMAPNPVVAGTGLTITGTNLDLVKQLIFGGKRYIDSVDFISQDLTTIEIGSVPVNAQTGKVGLITASGVTVESSVNLDLTVPTVVDISTSIKNGGTISVTGTNLQLVTNVAFTGGGTGDLSSRTSTTMNVKVPNSAKTGEVTFNTSINVPVPGGTVTIVDPSITNLAPLSVVALQTLTVSGNNLDNVAKVVFTGGVSVKPATAVSATLTVVVPVGTLSGVVKVVSVNGDTITSAQSITFTKTLPSGFSFVEPAAIRGKVLTINGTNLSLIKTLIFPDNAVATDYVSKSNTQIEVYVPMATTPGNATISYVTQIGETGTISPTIMVPSIEAVVDESYVFFNFNGTGKDSWWGNAMGSGISSTAPTADGTPYWNVNGTCGTGGWDGLFWRNGGNNLKVTGLLVNRDVVKFDLNVRQNLTAGELRVNLRGPGGEFYYLFKPWSSGTPYKTDGWETITCPLNQFKDNYGNGNPMTDANLQTTTGDFGMVWCSSTAITVNMGIDNVRFQIVSKK